MEIGVVYEESLQNIEREYRTDVGYGLRVGRLVKAWCNEWSTLRWTLEQSSKDVFLIRYVLFGEALSHPRR